MATLYTQPTQDWPVLGLQGQLLGNIVRCTLDTATGEIVHLELRTAWQTIGLDWPSLQFDENKQLFRLNKPANVNRPQGQASDTVSGCKPCES